MSSKLPTIIRAPHGRDNPYVQIRRDVLQDDGLSWAARGLLAYLLSKPDDWEVQISDLQQHCGRTKVYTLLNELIKRGYVERKTERDDKKRILSWYYQVYETSIKDDLLSRKLEIGNSDALHKKESTEKDSVTAQNAATPPAPQNSKTEVVNWSDVKGYFHSDTGTWDDGYVYIGRGGHIPGLKKSDWGNPFTMRPEGTDDSTDERKRVVEQYRAWINDPRRCKLYNRIFTELRGKKLVCHCAPDGCHGDVLADIANEPQARPYTRWFIGVFDAFGFFMEDNGQAQLILRGMNPTVKLDPPLRDADELQALAEWRRKTNAPEAIIGPELVEAVNTWRAAELYAPKAPPTVKAQSTVPSKKPRPRDLIFDAIAEGSFGIRNGQIEQEDKTPGGRIGKIKKWLVKHQPDVTPEEIQRFYVWYDSEIEASRPRDVGKFSEHWLAWENSLTTAAPATTYYTAPEAPPVSTPEEMAEKRRIIAEAMKNRDGGSTQ